MSAILASQLSMGWFPTREGNVQAPLAELKVV
jgi:hypothetical protein